MDSPARPWPADGPVIFSRCCQASDYSCRMHSAVHNPEKGTYFDVTAAAITLLITFLLTRGVKEAARANGIMVAIKIIVVLIFIGVGVFYVQPSNWQPFLPFGISGVTAGAATVFCLYWI